ncbi:M20 family metallo-hydrolase [Haliscomenobacter hydrossis]|uniref:Peptidase M20 n=1 Tax=Haliscomenobacter hydrossis (strain ATCC 27775 / DSM 1100 / LMG 10767 / O) TaxID=760192 RepID=F4KPH2_HALH1|nr:M20 family metallo-hydrolase [Haliscomenobacter hydrossis]AEE49926.1 peptidase M20 [Haliscomenobacter hydrossis DSM 1100]
MSVADSAIDLLKILIATPSFSKEEDEAAQQVAIFLTKRYIPFTRKGNNIWARNRHWQNGKPILLLNSHMDTVKPATGWQRDPFHPGIEAEDVLYGLGSNDAGGPLVALIATFLHFYEREDLPVNIIMAATAEEEISGAQGIASVIPELGPVDFAIVGEPTQMKMAIAEKGLMVVDGEAKGVSGHAAREEGINALYIALEDIERIRRMDLERVSPLLGKVKMTVTQIEAGKQHNVVPDSCRFVIDVRTNECYRNEEVFEILQSQLQSELTPRSFRLNSSGIALEHPLVQSGLNLGLPYFGSPTLSDQALMPFPSLKIGPGDSARSHTADEYIRLSEIRAGIDTYIRLIEGI